MYTKLSSKSLSLIMVLAFITTSGANLATAAPSSSAAPEKKSTEKNIDKTGKSSEKATSTASKNSESPKNGASKSAEKTAGKTSQVIEKASSNNGSHKENASSKNASGKAAGGKNEASKDATKTASAAPLANLSGTWNVKFHEAPSSKTHIMAVKVTQKNSALSATGVDVYGDVILEGTVTAPNKISFKRTYKGTQVNPAAQFEGTFTPATVLTPVTAKGTWTAQPFADKSLKQKASANSGDWEANIFTGPAINK
ncbi:MAG TPA: hypothetical protein V6C89_20305 [Drouetiella sp.]|jgi:hypothetical protein